MWVLSHSVPLTWDTPGPLVVGWGCVTSSATKELCVVTGAASRPEHISARSRPCRAFFLSVMGQHSGAINLGSGIRSHGAGPPGDPG